MKKNLHLLWLGLAALAVPPVLFAAEPTPSGKPPIAPNFTLVFSDDFSTDPNSNGKWTVFRRQGNSNREGYWDAAAQAWYLTRPSINLATAAFANYELTARVWKVDFDYLVDHGPTGADGFVFMFYKDKGAYGTPDSGTYMAFQTRNSDGSDNPVAGYGLQFDTYQYLGCDPILENYVALVQDVICESAQIYRPFDKVDDGVWHHAEFTFAKGKAACLVDGASVHGFNIPRPDYRHTGIGFGAGTGANFANQIIDNFQIWVASEE